jgi:glyoxylate reductase
MTRRQIVRPRVFVTRRIPSPGIELLEKECDVTIYDRRESIDHEELVKSVGDMDGLVCVPSDRIDGPLLDAAPRLRAISTYSVGYDHLDVTEATKRGIFIGYTPGVLTDATADHAFALLMGAARRVAQGDRYVRAGEWAGPFDPMLLLGESVWGATVGIIGLGRIGRAVAMRARGFCMKVLYHDVEKAAPGIEKELQIEYRPLDSLLRESDFVTIHAPYVKETHHLINEERLKLMKRTAVLVNTSRGPLVDESALARALREGRLSAAGLDVYEEEPIAPDNAF